MPMYFGGQRSGLYFSGSRGLVHKVDKQPKAYAALYTVDGQEPTSTNMAKMIIGKTASPPEIYDGYKIAASFEGGGNRNR